LLIATQSSEMKRNKSRARTKLLTEIIELPNKMGSFR
jgi:hypothetical protein